MEIGFIYPEISGYEYANSVELINDDIGRQNSKLFVPNILLHLIRLLLLILWAVAYAGLFFKMTYDITASDISKIVCGFFSYIVSALLFLQLIFYATKKLRPLILFIFKKRDAEESFSFSEYVKRNDPNKKVKPELGYYKMCDTLRLGRIVDASAVCDGYMCRVEVSYEGRDSSGTYTFYLKYHERPGLNKIIVDFNRKCVLFPEEENFDEEQTQEDY